jgi:AcrR family transcriptional regulator
MNRPRLNRTAIAATAILIADEKGFAAVTLRGIAARLGVHVTSLYNHVSTKEAVVDEMIEALIVQAKLPTGALAWQDWVRTFAAAMRTLAHDHPGAFEAFHYAPAQGKTAAEAYEAAFAAFRAGGFDTVAAYNAVKATTLAVLGLMLDDTARAHSGSRRSDVSKLPAERFPHVHEAARIVDDADTYSFLIDVLIHGLASSLSSRGSGVGSL